MRDNGKDSFKWFVGWKYITNALDTANRRLANSIPSGFTHCSHSYGGSYRHDYYGELVHVALEGSQKVGHSTFESRSSQNPAHALFFCRLLRAVRLAGFSYLPAARVTTKLENIIKKAKLSKHPLCIAS